MVEAMLPPRIVYPLSNRNTRLATAISGGPGNGSLAARASAKAASGMAQSPATETSLNETLYGTGTHSTATRPAAANSSVLRAGEVIRSWAL